jgi:hypothetical protein
MPCRIQIYGETPAKDYSWSAHCKGTRQSLRKVQKDVGDIKYEIETLNRELDKTNGKYEDECRWYNYVEVCQEAWRLRDEWPSLHESRVWEDQAWDVGRGEPKCITQLKALMHEVNVEVSYLPKAMKYSSKLRMRSSGV